MKKIFLHIGMPKTGTTAIQKFCEDNREFLAAHDISYPEVETEPKHICLDRAGNAFKLLANNGTVEKTVKRVVGIINHQKEDNIILSTEVFWEWIAKSDYHIYVISKLRDVGIEVNVIAYLRRQVDWVEAAWLQNVKHMNLCMSLYDYMSHPDMYDSYLNIERILDKLEKVVGFGRMHVRVYEREQLDGGDVVIDFFKNIFNMDIKNVYKSIAHEDVNSSIDIRTALIKKIINRTGYSSETLRQTFQKALVNSTQYNASRYGKEKASLLSQDEIFRYMELFRDSNRRVAEKYFHREKLFFESYRPSTQDVEILLGDVIYIFGSAISQLYENIQQIEQYRETSLQNHIRGKLGEIYYYATKVEKPIYIYGCGNAGKTLVSMLDREMHLDVAGFVESDDANELKTCMGYQVIPYNRIKNKNNYLFVIATVTESFKEEIRSQLQEDDIYDYYVL